MATSDDVTGPINLGNTGEFTVSELAEKVIAKVGGSSRIVYRELPSDDPKVRKPDITKAREVLGWEAKVALDEGLDKTIAYFAKVVAA
jgi:UDP-glucuronate decarboxylase